MRYRATPKQTQLTKTSATFLIKSYLQLYWSSVRHVNWKTDCWTNKPHIICPVCATLKCPQCYLKQTVWANKTTKEIAFQINDSKEPRSIPDCFRSSPHLIPFGSHRQQRHDHINNDKWAPRHRWSIQIVTSDSFINWLIQKVMQI